MNFSALQIFVFFVVWFFSHTVNADPAHCVANAGDPDAEIDVWLHYQSFEDFLYDETGTLGGLTVDEVIGALLQSMEEWNHSAAGTIFRYRGTTTSLVKGDCGLGVVRGGALNQLNEVVSLDGPATYISACSGRGFSIQIPANINQIPRRWVTGDPALVNNNPRYDLVGFFAHELGHALGMGHPTQAAGVMSNNTKRELFQLDTECAELYVNSNRELDLRQAFFWNGSVSYSVLAADIWSTGPGVSAGGGNFLPNQFRGVQMKASGLFAERYSGGLLTLNSATYHTAEPATRLHRRELHQNYRDAIIAQKRQTVYYGNQENERFRHRIYMSNDGFDTLTFHTDLRYCSTPSGSSPLSVCSAGTIVYSNHRIAGAYDDHPSVQRSVYVWTEQDRTNLSAINNTLYVSIGTYDGSYSNAGLIGKAFSAGVRSDVAPAVACKAYQAGSIQYDCMIAYTDPADAINSVRFRRFISIDNTTHFYPLFESGFQQISSSGWQRTASPIALFHHYGKWWVGLKLALSTGNGGIRWYSSTTGDTDTWQIETSTGFAVNGASAIGDWTVSNYLRWGE